MVQMSTADEVCGGHDKKQFRSQGIPLNKASIALQRDSQ